MRTLKRKRLWPALAIAPIFALAAILTIAVLAPQAEAQGVQGFINQATGSKCELDMGANGASGLEGGPCRTSGDSVEVTLKLSDDGDGSTADDDQGRTIATDDTNVLFQVYVTGGDEYPNVRASNVATTAVTDDALGTWIGKKGVDEHDLDFQRMQDDSRGRPVVSEWSTTVTRSMARDGDVYLFVYEGVTNANIPLDKPDGTVKANVTGFPIAPTTGTDNVAKYVVKVEFTDPPSLTRPDRDDDGERDPASAIVFGTRHGTTGAITDGSITSDGEATITVYLEDKNGHPLNGFVDDLTLESDDAKVVFQITGKKTFPLRVTNGVGTAVVEGLPKDDSAVRVKVTGTTSNGLPLIDYITQEGPVAELTLTTYQCDAPATGDTDVCSNRTAATSALKVATTFGPGDSILAVSKATDAVGNTLDTQITIAEKVASGVDVSLTPVPVVADYWALDPVDATATGILSRTREVLTIGESGTSGQTYTIEASVGTVKATQEIRVAGDAAELMISGPDMLDAVTGVGEYTITVSDGAGNVPSNIASITGVAVVVRGAASPVGLGTGNKLDFNDSTGKATVTISADDDAVLGTSVTIIAVGNDLPSATKTVTYGMAPVNLTLDNAKHTQHLSLIHI